MVLRSPSGTPAPVTEEAGGIGSDERELASARLFPHAEQNFDGKGFWAPHFKQVRVSDAPHSEQCLLDAGFSVAQVGQCISTAN